MYDPDIHRRRSIRLKGHDYAQTGAYFITICTKNRGCLFGEIVGGEMRMNDSGRMVRSVWDALRERFPGLDMDAAVVMPNHIHGIVVITNRRGESCIRPESNQGDREDQGDHKDRPYGTSAGTIGRIVQTFKSVTTHAYILGIREQGRTPFPGQLWQRNYYEHVIRDETDLESIREYIAGNPARWAEDRENPAHMEANR